MTKRPFSIRRRITLNFAVLSLIVSLIFSSFNVVFMWSVEDEAFKHILQTEKENILSAYRAHGEFGKPGHESVQLILRRENLPAAIRQGLRENQHSGEFFGVNGENYHFLHIHSDPEAYLLGEFSRQLIVTPALYKVLFLLFVVTILITGLSCAIGYYLADRAVRPLSKLVALLRSSAPEKLPENFAGEFAGDEVGFLARTLEASLVRIKDFITREQNFTRDVGHELRTPIAVIKGVGELLSQQPLVSQRAPLERLQLATLQMEQIIVTLLSLAHEEGHSVRQSRFRVLPKVEELIIQHAMLIENKPVEVMVDINDSDELVADPVVAEIVFSNLISNAFKHTRRGRVKITYRAARFSVCDNGEGIDEALRDSAFEMGVKTSDSSGFGIGLSLVKRLCEQRQIGLSVISTRKGTSISLDFGAADQR